MHSFVYYRAKEHSEQKKIKIYKTLIRPVATYGTGSWALNTDIVKRLAAIEREVLRRMFGRN
jgi:hypothetical protein